MNIYVGNISFNSTEDDVRTAFAAYGEVASVKIITDRENNNRSKGFGFVEMPNDNEALSAIDGLDGADLEGRQLKVNKARPKSR